MALLMWARARRHILQSGVPDGHVVYQDTYRRRNVERALVSPSCGLTGKPDDLVEAPNGLIPVELKSRNCPAPVLMRGEAAQVTACCVLVEDSFGATPPHGIIQYADRWFFGHPIPNRHRDQILKDTHRLAQCDACLVVLLEIVRDSRARIALLPRFSSQAETPSTGNPVSTDLPLSSTLISTSCGPKSPSW